MHARIRCRCSPFDHEVTSGLAVCLRPRLAAHCTRTWWGHCGVGGGWVGVSRRSIWRLAQGLSLRGNCCRSTTSTVGSLPDLNGEFARASTTGMPGVRCAAKVSERALPARQEAETGALPGRRSPGTLRCLDRRRLSLGRPVHRSCWAMGSRRTCPSRSYRR
jgi:hypothetical protein